MRRPLLLPLIAGIAVLSATLVGFGQVSPGPPGTKPPSTAPAREALPPTGKPTIQPNGPIVPPGQGTSVPGGAPADDKIPPEKVVPLVSYPDDPKLAIAQRLLSSGHFEYAKNLITQVLDARPEVGRAEFFLGVALTKMKKYEDARPHLERSLQLRQPFPEAKHAHHFMGWASYHLGELGRARSDFEAHLAEVPDEPDSIFALGLIAFDEDRLDDAEKHFQRAIELFQQNLGADNRELPSAMFGLAMAEYGAGRSEEARKVAEAALAVCRKVYGEVHPGIGHCAGLLGNIAADAKDFAAAQRHFEAGLEVLKKVEGERSREVATAIHNLGWLAGERGDLPAAQSRVEEALAIRREILDPNDPSFADGHMLLGLVHERAGRIDDALRAVREALRIRTQAFGADHAETRKAQKVVDRLTAARR